MDQFDADLNVKFIRHRDEQEQTRDRDRIDKSYDDNVWHFDHFHDYP